jgi:hypothetical protein
MAEYSSKVVFADWDKYCDKARELLDNVTLNGVVEINATIKGRSGDTRYVYIEPFLVKGNKRIIERLSRIKEFHGNKIMGIDNKYRYQGWIEIEEIKG